jgi:hypothetical protein
VFVTLVWGAIVLADIFKKGFNAPDIVYGYPGLVIGVLVARRIVVGVRSRNDG